MPELPGTPAALAKMIDHAVLKPDATRNDLRAGCELAARLKLASICVRSFEVAAAAGMLAGSGCMCGSVVGFPHGSQNSAAKAAETRQAIADGAEEIDMVLPIGWLIDGALDDVRRDIAGVVLAADGRCVKVILECCYLTDEQVAAGCRASVEAGAHFVKTSTGFGTHGAKIEHVRLMRQTVGPDIGVKAAGGIRSWADARAMIGAGATRLGTSAAEVILAEMQ